jgi:hypothetical protein
METILYEETTGPGAAAEDEPTTAERRELLAAELREAIRRKVGNTATT